MIAWLAVAWADDPDLRFWRGRELLRGRPPVEWASADLWDCGGGVRLDQALVSVSCVEPRGHEVRVGWTTPSLLAGAPERVDGEPFRPGHVGRDADFDGDGVVDAVAIFHRRGEIWLKVSWGVDPVAMGALIRLPLPPDLQTVRWDAVGDLDGDGRDELALSLTTGTSSRFFVATGATLDEWDGKDRGLGVDSLVQLGKRQTGTSGLAACDLDGDGLPELLGADAVWSGRRLLERPRARRREIGQPVCLGDLDGDGAEEVVAIVEGP